MKRIFGTKNVIAMCATLFLVGTSMTACVSTDEGEATDPAVVASAAAAPASNGAAKDEKLAESAGEVTSENAKSEAAAPANVAEKPSVGNEAPASAADKDLNNAVTNTPAAPAEATPPASNNANVVLLNEKNAAENAPVDVASPVAAPTPVAEQPAADPFAQQQSIEQAVAADVKPAAQPAAPASVSAPVEQPAAAPASVSAPVEQPAASVVDTIPVAPGSESVGALPEEGSLLAYRVQKGDTLASIASHIYGTTKRWQELANQNNLSNADLIYTGDVILYRLDAKAKTFASKNESTPKKLVKVVAGDSLWTIAQRELGTATAWRAILKDNPRIKNPDMIKVGMELIVTNWMHVAQGEH